jgi:hypothetical protein
MHKLFPVRSSEISFKVLLISLTAYTKQLGELRLCVFALKVYKEKNKTKNDINRVWD